jgi:glyoxylase-like metal-dependent hydrolase (beta-lactamase superfamily II)
MTSGTAAASRAWSSGAATDRAYCVLAPNPGPMTLDGTNTWVLQEPGSDVVAVLDPGPLDPHHHERVRRQVESTGARVGAVLLTHDHPDHAQGAAAFAAGVGATVRAPRSGDLVDGQVVDLGGLELRIVGTPGHTSDSVSILIPADQCLLTGDTVLGRGTTVVAWPDGALAPYLSSLERIAGLIAAGAVRTILPGHGPTVSDPGAWLEFYLTHRGERLDQVAAAVAMGARTPREVVQIVYADVPGQLWDAAELSVRAQLDYLTARGDAADRGR